MKFDPASFEAKWRERWAAAPAWASANDERAAKKGEKRFCLVEFPYPSGNLHVGHWYAFSVPDIYVRHLRMKGENVLFPIGFDAFGLPAENAAIKHGVNPRDWTRQNMATMETQLRSMGASFDWDRQVASCEPDYYRWTQWLFLKLLDAGLAYQAETAVNWCPTDKTVLANEQVKDGKCDRCGSEIEQRRMKQWMLRTTRFADALVDGLDSLPAWPEAIKAAQREWIGRSEGAEFDFKIDGTEDSVTVFTTRADTLYGVTYVVLAPEHPLVAKLAVGCPNRAAIEAYAAEAGKKRELDRLAGAAEKTGVPLEGVFALNPANGEKVPVWVADYVLGSYGTGAVMAVPAHDERDWEFAKKFSLPTRHVVAGYLRDTHPTWAPDSSLPWKDRPGVAVMVKHWVEDSYAVMEWPTGNRRTFVTGGIEEGETPEQTAVREIREELGYTDIKSAKVFDGRSRADYCTLNRSANYRLVGTYVHVELASDAAVAVDEKELAIHKPRWVPRADLRRYFEENAKNQDPRYSIFGLNLLERGEQPVLEDGAVISSGEFDGLLSAEARPKIAAKFGRPKTQYRLRDWLVSRQRYWGCPIPVVHCAACGPVGVPESELPVELPDLDSYLPADDGSSPLARSAEFVKATCPKCGADAKRETDTLDTFIDSSWYYYRYADPKNSAAFADRAKIDSWLPVDVYSGGAEHTTMHVLYARFFQRALASIGLAPDREPFTFRFNRSLIMGPDGQKMSKSKGNVIDPDAEVARHGADTVRMYLAFMGPYAEVNAYPWDPNGVTGIRRFLERVWSLAERVAAEGAEASAPAARAAVHRAVAKVGEDIPRFKFNTAIAAMMTAMNDIGREPVAVADLEIFLKVLAPFAPFTAAEIWESVLGRSGSIHAEAWPEADQAALAAEGAKIAVQVNGKLRATLSVAKGAAEAEVLPLALAEAAVARALNGAAPKRVVYVADKLLNLVA